MDFRRSAVAEDYLRRLTEFMHEEVMPAEAQYKQQLNGGGDWSQWRQPEVMERLKARARELGLWNLFLPGAHGAGLSNAEYATLAEYMGRSIIAPEVFNCNAPDTGNMEVLEKYGSPEQQAQWLQPLLAGEIRSAFCMTEPDVASSDATNMQATAIVDGDEVVLNGRKWWSSGIGHPNCKVLIFMGLTDPSAERHRQHSMVLVPLDTPGVQIERMLPVFGAYDEPFGHGEVTFNQVRLPLSAFIGGPGRGFEIAQGRLGPGRIHHCMRTIGVAERALESMCKRLLTRVAFGKKIADHSVWEQRVAEARTNIEMCRLLVLKAAWMMDEVGAKNAKSEIAQIKVAAPRMALKVIDDAIQAWGGAGVTSDPGLAKAYAHQRTLRLADGPDEVHRNALAKLELAKHMAVAREVEMPVTRGS